VARLLGKRGLSFRILPILPPEFDLSLLLPKSKAPTALG
jgi:hypothetical protein